MTLERAWRDFGALVLTAATVAMLLAAVPASAEPFGPGSVEGTPKEGKVRARLFGMGMDRFPSQWPTTIPFGAARVEVRWAGIERKPGVYDWSPLDDRVGIVRAHGVRPLLYILGAPEFRASGAVPVTTASPPDPRHYAVFVRELVARFGDQVDYQVWNEPSVEQFFTGTPADAAELTRVLSRVVEDVAPEAMVVAPSTPLRGENPAFRKWFRAYLRQSPGPRERSVVRFFDAAAVSAYPMPDEDPEDGLALTQYARRVLARSGFSGPLWVTEINYGANGGEPTPPIPARRQAAWVIRTYALHATLGGERVFWWSWVPSSTVNTQLQDGDGTLTAAGKAFGVVQEWLLRTKPLGCETRRGVSRCGFRVAKGVERHVLWTRSGRIRPVQAMEGARSVTHPDGASKGVEAGEQLRVGLTPIMIETRSR